jgi:hypothetical protein
MSALRRPLPVLLVLLVYLAGGCRLLPRRGTRPW